MPPCPSFSRTRNRLGSRPGIPRRTSASADRSDSADACNELREEARFTVSSSLLTREGNGMRSEELYSIFDDGSRSSGGANLLEKDYPSPGVVSSRDARLPTPRD